MRKPVTLTVLRSSPLLRRKGPNNGAQSDSNKNGRQLWTPRPAKEEENKAKDAAHSARAFHQTQGGQPVLLYRGPSRITCHKPHGVKVQPGAPRHLAQSLSAERWIPMDTRESACCGGSSPRPNSALDKLKARADFEKNDLNTTNCQSSNRTAWKAQWDRPEEGLWVMSMEYSRVNLVCEVPIKAIDDLRKMWSEEFTPHPRHVKECAKGKFRAFTYDRSVCARCAPSSSGSASRRSIDRRSKRGTRRSGGGPVCPMNWMGFGTPCGSSTRTGRIDCWGRRRRRSTCRRVRVPAAPLAVDGAHHGGPPY